MKYPRSKRALVGILAAMIILGIFGFLVFLQAYENASARVPASGGSPSSSAPPIRASASSPPSADPAASDPAGRSAAAASGAGYADAVDYLDSGGLCYLKDSVGQLLMSGSQITTYGQSKGIGSSGTKSSTDCLQEGVNYLVVIGGGAMQLLSGRYLVSSTVSIAKSGVAIEGTLNEGGAGTPDGGSVIQPASSSVSPVLLISTTASSLSSVTFSNFIVTAPSGGASRSEVGIQIGTPAGDAAVHGASRILFSAVTSEAFGFDLVTYDTAGYQDNFDALTLLAPLTGGAVFDGANQFYFNGVEMSNYDGSTRGQAGLSADMIFGDALGTGHLSVDQQIVFNGGHIAYNNVAMKWVSDVGARALTFIGTEFESIVHYFDIEHDQSGAIRATITDGVFYSNTATQNFITSLGGGLNPYHFDAAITLQEGNVFGSYAPGFSYNSLPNSEAVLLVYPSVHFDGGTPFAPLASNSGVAYLRGDGFTRTFTVPHGLLNVQLEFSASPDSSSCSNLGLYVTYDSSSLIFNFDTAPPSGTYCAVSWSGQYVPNSNY